MKKSLCVIVSAALFGGGLLQAASGLPAVPQKVVGVAAEAPVNAAGKSFTLLDGKRPNVFVKSYPRLTAKAFSEAEGEQVLLSATFDDDLEGFTTIDANGDGKTWYHNVLMGNGAAKVDYSSVATDDWLISPAVTLIAGETYRLSLDAKGISKSFTESFEVCVGTSPTVEGMTETVIAQININHDNYQTYNGEFVAPADGDYYFGVRGMSKKDQFALLVDNITITGVAPAPPVEGVKPPFTATFDTDLDGFEVIDANHDGKTWKHVSSGGNGEAKVENNAKLATDDWLISPPIELVAGKTYTVSVDAKGYSKSYPESFELKAGTECKESAMTLDVIPATTFKQQVYETYSAEFIPESDGVYYFGIHGISEKDQFALLVDNFIVSAPAEPEVNLPVKPENVAFAETDKDGEVTISWDAVTADIDGTSLDASQVTYEVYILGNSDMTRLADNISGTEYTYQAVPEGQQKFVQFAVYPVTEKGRGEGAPTGFGPVGTPYNGYQITAEADLDRYILGVDVSGGLTAGIYGDDDFEEMTSYDLDDFYLGFYGTYIDKFGSVFTGKISLKGMVNPAFIYYTYNLALDNGDKDMNELATLVTDMATGEQTTVATTIVGDTGGADQWNRVYVDLSAYAGKVISLTLKATAKSASYTFVDNLTVSSLVPYDLEATSVSVPATVVAGQEYTAQILVKNLGSAVAEGYTVSLYKDGALVGSKEGESLAAGAYATVDFPLSTSPVDLGSVVFYATVDFTEDEVGANNRTPDAAVEIVKPNLPEVDDLQGTSENGGIRLVWSEPNLENASSDPVTETFEDGEAFGSTHGDWKFVDVDGSPVGGISTQDIPGITPGTTTGAFWIWDTELLPDAIAGAHSGKKFLFSMFRYDDETVDDWAISPKLDGSAQTISFYAKSYSMRYGETIEVYYSESGDDIEDFQIIRDAEKVLPYWEEYKVELPAGARYFAIRSCGTASYMLMIDDVTFIPSGNANLELMGYNVYRDGVKVNAEMLEETEFVDGEVKDGETYTYGISTVYTKGESAASNTVDVVYVASGLDSATLKAVTVKAVDGSIVIGGASGVEATVCTTEGKTVFAGTCRSTESVAVAPGIYLVKVGDTVVKIVVR